MKHDAVLPFKKMIVQIFDSNFRTLLFLLWVTPTPTLGSSYGKICAVLRSDNESYRNASLTLTSDSVFGNIAEEYLEPEKTWNTSTASWTVRPSCELKTCTGVYLSNECATFKNNDTVSRPANWLSASCKCNMDCTPPNDFGKISVCARAYLKENGEELCDAEYTELLNEPQPPDILHKVSHFLVRSGCNLTVADVDESEETIIGPQLMEWNNEAELYSYECECEGSKYTPPVASSTSTGIQNVNIPNTLDELVTKLQETSFDNNGLLAALSSYSNGRSPKNAYLLLLGSTGAGKSSAINVLTGTPNLTRAGDVESTTSEILEFRIPVQVPELGIANSELRIIDTPGLGDTREAENDARFMATLEEYLDNHDELQSKIPNLVLIFHTFADNRFDGEGARFVRMIRGLDSIRTRITDQHYSNVLFVFTHLCSEGKSLQTNPLPKLMKFKDVVERYSFFPKPIMTAVAENKGKENELFMRKGNVELPNHEYYPKNLLDRFDSITSGGQDRMGNAIFNTDAVRQQTLDVSNMTRLSKRLVSNSHQNVAKYLSSLASSAYNMQSTEVSNLLSQAYAKLKPDLKARYPDALQQLQKYLNLKNIRSKTDLPQTAKEILQLISGVEQNEAIEYLQEEGLNLKGPIFPGSTVAGYSYNILTDTILPTSPFKVGNRRSSNIGFMLPKVLRSTRSIPPQKPVKKFQIFNTQETYFQHRISSLFGTDWRSYSVNSPEIFTTLTKRPEKGDLVKSVKCSGTSNMFCFTVSRFYKAFELNLETAGNSENLDSDFSRRLTNISPLNLSDYASIEDWSSFFNQYGTHVVKSAEGGGKIDLQFSLSSQVPIEATVDEVLKYIDFLEDPYAHVVLFESIPTLSPNSLNHTVSFHGGNPEYHISDISKMRLDDAVKILKKWEKSINTYPFLMPKEIVPIEKAVSNFFPVEQRATISEKVKVALSHLLGSTLKYVEPPPDPEVLDEFVSRRHENEKRLKQLKVELERMGNEAIQQRQAALAQQQKLQEEARRLDDQRRRQAEIDAERRRKEKEDIERLAKLERDRQRQAQAEADRRHREFLRQFGS